MPLSDVAIVGGGVIGLCVASAAAERGMSVVIARTAGEGDASRAAAGMLAPSVERPAGVSNELGFAARDRYPSFLDFVEERTGLRVPLNREGILQVALTERGVKGLRRSLGAAGCWLDRTELTALEPALAHALGAVHTPLDGSVDNVSLMGALEALVARTPRISLLSARVACVAMRASGVTLSLESGDTMEAGACVIAGGAWSRFIDGARLAAAVTPLKGQLVSYPSAQLHHVAYGPRGYLVPRGTATIGGSTSEDTGFDAAISDDGISRVKSAAEEICPALAGCPAVSAWAGLRPVTPDLLPLLGPDPESPRVVYACGHSRNGILLAPLTGDIVADLLTGSPLRHDLVQFRPDRF